MIEFECPLSPRFLESSFACISAIIRHLTFTLNIEEKKLPSISEGISSQETSHRERQSD